MKLPSHACLLVAPGRTSGWTVETLVQAVGRDMPVLRLPDGERVQSARFAELKAGFLALAQDGREMAVDTSGLRHEQIGHLSNLADRHFLTPVMLDLDSVVPSAPGEPLEIRRTLPRTWRPWEKGPFDIIGDVHGCSEELTHLIDELGYRWRVFPLSRHRDSPVELYHPEGRRLAFLGDFTDRGPEPVDTLHTVMSLCRAGALAVLGNHDEKLRDFLLGRKVTDRNGFQETREAIERLSDAERAAIRDFLVSLPSHLVLDDGRLVLAHAGCREPMQGRDTNRVTEFCVNGENTGERDADGYPIRVDWAADYHGKALVVYGHVPAPEVRWNGRGNAVCIDTGCCFGGGLTALRWPEREIVYVPAARSYEERREFGM